MCKLMIVSVVWLVAVCVHTSLAWQIHFSSGNTANNAEYAQPGQTVGFWTGFASASPSQPDPQTADVSQPLAYSVTCSENQFLSQLQTVYDLNIDDNPGGTLVLETRIRISNATVVAFVDTPLVTYTTYTASNSGYDQFQTEKSTWTAPVLCPAGSLIVLETRITCDGCVPSLSYVFFQFYLAASVRASQVQTVGFSSGILTSLPATGLLGSANLVPVFDILDYHGASWLCNRNQTFYALQTSVMANVSVAWNATVWLLHDLTLEETNLKDSGQATGAGGLVRSVSTTDTSRTVDCAPGDALTIQVSVSASASPQEASIASLSATVLFY